MFFIHQEFPVFGLLKEVSRISFWETQHWIPVGYTICSAELDSSHIVGIFWKNACLLICLFDKGHYAICYRFQCLVMPPVV